MSTIQIWSGNHEQSRLNQFSKRFKYCRVPARCERHSLLLGLHPLPCATFGVPILQAIATLQPKAEVRPLEEHGRFPFWTLVLVFKAVYTDCGLPSIKQVSPWLSCRYLRPDVSSGCSPNCTSSKPRKLDFLSPSLHLSFFYGQFCKHGVFPAPSQYHLLTPNAILP